MANRLGKEPQALAARVLLDLVRVTGIEAKDIKASRHPAATAARRAWAWLIRELGDLRPVDVEAVLDRTSAKQESLHAHHPGTRSREVLVAFMREVEDVDLGEDWETRAPAVTLW